MSAFGHTGIISPGVCIDSWGAGPFVIAAGGKSYRFGDSDRFGPYLATKLGDPLKNAYPPERCPFWRAHRIWKRQGRRTEDGVICIWDEPKASIVRHLHGRQYISIEAGEDDGVTLVRTDDGDIPMREYQARRRPIATGNRQDG